MRAHSDMSMIEHLRWMNCDKVKPCFGISYNCSRKKWELRDDKRCRGLRNSWFSLVNHYILYYNQNSPVVLGGYSRIWLSESQYLLVVLFFLIVFFYGASLICRLYSKLRSNRKLTVPINLNHFTIHPFYDSCCWLGYWSCFISKH